MSSKCSVFEKIDDVAQIEKIPACSKNGVSEKVLLQFICLQGFNIYPLKILLTISLVQISTWRLSMSRTAANHVEEHFDNHSDDKIQ